MRTIEIARDDSGQRIDRFLRKYLRSATLGHVFKLLRQGRVRINGRRVKPDVRLVEGDELTFHLSDEHFADLSASRRGSRSAPAARSKKAVRVLHRDEHVLGVDKPPMLLVQPGDNPAEPSLDRLVLDLVGEGDALTFRPALAHRLDRGTSGVVLFGLSAAGLRGLTHAFRSREVDKRYLALVLGQPDDDRFRVDLPLARDPSDERRGARVKVSRGHGSQPAATEFRVLSRSTDGRLTLLEARPLTGRTHQIRVHLRAVRLPIAGDRTYGDPKANRRLQYDPGLWRQFLHAWRIGLTHPVDTDTRLAVVSPLPEDLRRMLRAVGLEEPRGEAP